MSKATRCKSCGGPRAPGLDRASCVACYNQQQRDRHYAKTGKTPVREVGDLSRRQRVALYMLRASARLPLFD